LQRRGGGNRDRHPDEAGENSARRSAVTCSRKTANGTSSRIIER
jgi:hypothetical protein